MSSSEDQYHENDSQQEIQEHQAVRIMNSNQFLEDNQSQNQQEPTDLKSWVQELNDKYHSEDEGIEDYKIGGYHPCHVGEILSNRYVLIQKLGWGHFSTVWLAKDFKFGTYVAVKVMKSAPHYIQASYDQVEILQKIAKLSSSPEWLESISEIKKKKIKQITRDDSHVLNLLNCFLYKGPYGNHFCMVYEILGVNLLEVLKRTDYKGLSLDTVREITKQVLIGLDFLNRICKIIHTDLKPENVLVCLTDQEVKKIVDDGQLNSRDVFQQRLKYYRKNFGFADQNYEETSDYQSEEKEEQKKQLSSREKKINQLQKRLNDETLNKNTKKSLRRKIRKLQIKLQKKDSNADSSEGESEEQQKEKQVKKDKKKKQKKEIRKDILERAVNPKLVFDKLQPLEKGFKIKIADLGNACWTHYHFATQIQTRQYRGPEVIIGSRYNTTADLWSLACMTFEMLTGDLLFNPKRDKNDIYGKNDDHIAQMMELLGIFPQTFSRRCSKFKKYFSDNGKLKRVPSLQQWSIKDFMIAKYGYNEDEALKFEQFMVPMLKCLPQKRASAQSMLNHVWLGQKTIIENEKMSTEDHEKIKKDKYHIEEQREQVWNYTSDKEDGSLSSNGDYKDGGDSDDEWYGRTKTQKYIKNIRNVDHSFTDIGYTGYSEGINLEKLDSISNWQFT